MYKGGPNADPERRQLLAKVIALYTHPQLVSFIREIWHAKLINNRGPIHACIKQCISVSVYEVLNLYQSYGVRAHDHISLVQIEDIG